MTRGKVLLSDLVFYLINIFFVLAYLLWTITYWSDRDFINDFNESIFVWIVLLFIVQSISFCMKKVSRYDFCLWFTLLSYPFMFGYLFRDIFSLQTTLLWNPINNYSQTELFHSYLYVIGSLHLFSFGYLLFFKRTNILSLVRTNVTIPKDSRVYNLGKIFLGVGFCFTLVHDIPIILFMQAENSYLSYSNAVSSGISGSLALFMLPGIFFMFFSGYLNLKRKKALFICALLYFLIFMTLTGSRKLQVFSIISLFLGYGASNTKDRFTFSKFLKGTGIVIMVLFVLTLLVTIREYRFDLSQLGTGLIENIYSLNILGMLFGEIIAETGLTGLSVASIISVVPDYLPYQYGITFIRTIPSVLPIGWLLKDFFSQASSTYVINLYTGIPVGASMFGDLYWNFGYCGLLFSFFFGVFFCWLLEKQIDKEKIINYRFYGALYFSIFSILIILVRSEFFDIFRPVVYVSFASFFLLKVLYHNRKEY